ncbi:MAG: site-specific integrase [Pseudomonadota bacterium]
MAGVERVRISKSMVERMEPQSILRDTVLSGFGVRRQGGAPVYFLQTRVAGRLRWFSIGKHGAWTVDTARKEAQRLLREISAGNDPRSQAKQNANRPTIAEASVEFMATHGKTLKERTRGEYQTLLDNFIVKKLGKTLVTDVTRADAIKFHTELEATPYRANFALRVLSKMMSWCEEMGYRTLGSNPCQRIKKFKEQKRQTFLSMEELVRLGDALHEVEEEGSESVYGIAAIRLYLLTGCRKNEILPLLWTEVDLGKHRLNLNDSKTGEKVVELNPDAVEVLAAIPRVASNPYVIVGAKEGHHLVAIQDVWERVRARARLENVRLHDLRHSFASFVADDPDANLIKLGKLLGHTNPQTTARYAHLFKDQQSALNDRTGSRIGQGLKKKS